MAELKWGKEGKEGPQGRGGETKGEGGHAIGRRGRRRRVISRIAPDHIFVFWAAALLGTESHPWSSKREEEGTAPFPHTRREGGRSKRILHPSQNAARKGEEEK